MRYDEYLQSDEWKARRAQARQRAKNRCEHCGGPPDHVHHVRYPKNFKDDVLENLIVVCESCHMKHHGIRGKEMTNAIVLHFEDKQLVATKHGDDLLFRFRDAFDALEYGESTSAFKAVQNAFLPAQVYASAWARISEEYRVEMREEIIGGTDRIVRYVKEKGLYLMAMHSSSAKAKRFQDWLADVAMSIRQHGCYPPPDLPVMSTEDQEHVFLLGLLNSATEAKKVAKQALMIASEARDQSLKTYQAFEQIESDIRDYITSRRFCADNRIPSGKMDINIKNLGSRATKICESEGIRYLPKARQDGDFPANAYPRDVLARAAREIGLLH